MIKYALLGLLREQSDYGYHLKERFDERIGAAWDLNIGQVYQTLRAMSRAGLISPVSDAGDVTVDLHPVRRRFLLTVKGSKVLERWQMQRPRRPRPMRDEILIYLLVLGPSRGPEVRARIEAQEQLYRHHYAHLLGQKRRLLRRTKKGCIPVAHFGLEAALLHAEAHLKWLAFCREQLPAASEPGDEASSRKG